MGLFNKKVNSGLKKYDAVEKDFSFGYGLDIVPIFTEKSHSLNGFNKYSFKSSKGLSKDEIKVFVEKVYNVKVLKVNTSVSSKKKKRTIKYNRGYQKPYKKAIVTLDKGQSISDFQKA